ncbi:hypothetical protein [Sulfoacidibacillus ferrooxidans]|uniref:DUF1641 domain-containing protein n=1 Tax=Sulfoacidibacillus ferrooxidans TaxID=2005001 RepID=A0A9X2AFJ6_9BACL|nr:hypothetical protein [Sulfoacidibacillus ferrooxidans]MCI0184512.1 hypothetical protein [Sulfoacidibacillus ferrooxidans]
MTSESLAVDQVDELLEILGDNTIQNATVTVLRAMPTIAKWLGILELGTELIEPMVKDPELILNITNELSKLKKTGMVDNLNTLMDQLPLLVKMTSYLEMGMDLLEPMAKDPELLDNILQSIKQLSIPLKEDVFPSGIKLFQVLPVLLQLTPLLVLTADLCKPIISRPTIITDALLKSSEDKSSISMFRLAKLRKDPTVQHSLRFMIALLQELSDG